MNGPKPREATGYYTPAVQGTSAFNMVGPTRVPDTRSAIGVSSTTPLGPGGTLTFQVEGTASGIPTNEVTAVVLNLTAVDATASSNLTAYPNDGNPQPATSDVNFAANETIANLVIVRMPANVTSIKIHNAAGSTDVLADAIGYYTTGTGSVFDPIDTGLLDTRTAGPSGTDAPLQPNVPRPQQITGLDGIPADGTVSAVVLHVTVVNPTVDSFLVAYPDGSTRPATSNLNYLAGDLLSNIVIVPVGADGKVDFYNHVGTTDIVVSVVSVQGYFST